MFTHQVVVSTRALVGDRGEFDSATVRGIVNFCSFRHVRNQPLGGFNHNGGLTIPLAVSCDHLTLCVCIDQFKGELLVRLQAVVVLGRGEIHGGFTHGTVGDGVAIIGAFVLCRGRLRCRLHRFGAAVVRFRRSIFTGVRPVRRGIHRRQEGVLLPVIGVQRLGNEVDVLLPLPVSGGGKAGEVLDRPGPLGVRSFLPFDFIVVGRHFHRRGGVCCVAIQRQGDVVGIRHLNPFRQFPNLRTGDGSLGSQVVEDDSVGRVLCFTVLLDTGNFSLQRIIGTIIGCTVLVQADGNLYRIHALVIDVRIFAANIVFLDGVGKGLGVVLRLLHIVEVVADRIKGYLASLIVVLCLQLISIHFLERKAEGAGDGKRRPIQLFFCGQFDACGQRLIHYGSATIFVIEFDICLVKARIHHLELCQQCLGLFLGQPGIFRRGLIQKHYIMLLAGGLITDRHGGFCPVVQVVQPDFQDIGAAVFIGRTITLHNRTVLLDFVCCEGGAGQCRSMIVLFIDRELPRGTTDIRIAHLVGEFTFLRVRNRDGAGQFSRILQGNAGPLFMIQHTEDILHHDIGFVRQSYGKFGSSLLVLIDGTGTQTIRKQLVPAVVVAVILVAIVEANAVQNAGILGQGILQTQGNAFIFHFGRDQVHFVRIHANRIDNLIPFNLAAVLVVVGNTTAGQNHGRTFIQQRGCYLNLGGRLTDLYLILRQGRIVGDTDRSIVVGLKDCAGHLGIVGQGILFLFQAGERPAESLSPLNRATDSGLIDCDRRTTCILQRAGNIGVSTIGIRSDVPQAGVHCVLNGKLGRLLQITNISQIKIDLPFNDHPFFGRSTCQLQFFLCDQRARLFQQAAEIDLCVAIVTTGVIFGSPVYNSIILEVDLRARHGGALLQFGFGRIGDPIDMVHQRAFLAIVILVNRGIDADCQVVILIGVPCQGLIPDVFVYHGPVRRHFLDLDVFDRGCIRIHAGAGCRDLVRDNQAGQGCFVLQVTDRNIQRPFGCTILIGDIARGLFDCNGGREFLFIIDVGEVQLVAGDSRVGALEGIE